jgi:hypothetical protein
VRGTKDIEDLGQALLAHHLTDANNFGIFGWYAHSQVALCDPEDEILFFLTLDDPSLDGLDKCGPVVGVNNGLADTENH